MADSLAGQTGKFAESQANDVRLYALGVTDDRGQQVGTVVAALSLEPYERTVKKALVASVVFAALMLVAVALATRFLLGRALDPVAEMTRSATEWSEHDLEHRFAAGEPYDEITALAAAFDSMLDKLAASLRHEQRLTAEISHELRTPLAAIIAETELALAESRDADADGAALGHIAERSEALRQILDALLAAARAESSDAHPTTAIQDALASTAAAARRDAPPGIEVNVSQTPGLVVDAETPLLERILHPIVENALTFASARIALSARLDGTGVLIEVADDGPGVGEEDAEQVFEPGYRGSQDQRRTSAGTGLGLALSRRLAHAAGGDVFLAPSEQGAVFEVRLPGRRQP
ncbi:MAG: HAMP domain-containing sensor histidine kinase [Solirubrobacterales bacterium]